jgi:hypothetical protein
MEGPEGDTQHTFEKHEENISDFESTIALLQIVNYYIDRLQLTLTSLGTVEKTVHVERYSQQDVQCIRIPS